MQKIIRHKQYKSRVNGKMKTVSNVLVSRATTENYRYMKKMCSDCKFFNGTCSKGFVAADCAKKGLKYKN